MNPLRTAIILIQINRFNCYHNSGEINESKLKVNSIKNLLCIIGLNGTSSFGNSMTRKGGMTALYGIWSCEQPSVHYPQFVSWLYSRKAALLFHERLNSAIWIIWQLKVMTDFCRTDMPMNQRIFLSLSGGSQPPPAILVADYKKVCLCKPQYFFEDASV